MAMSELIGPPPAPADDRAHVVPRQKFFNDMPDKGLFGIVSAAGFMLIFFLKQFDFNADVIAAVAVAIMILYGAIAFRLPRVGLRPDRLGDNFYYLGFIYTLASLSAALFQLRTGLDSGVGIDQLLGSFGIALVTTIVGITGRVMFVQLRGDIDEIEERARSELATTSAELRAQLGGSIREFETLRTSLLQTLNETAQASAHVMKQQADHINTLAQTTAKQLETAFQEGRTQVDALALSLQAVAQAVDQINKRASAMQLPSEVLNQQIAEFAKELEAILLRVGETADEVARRALTRRRWRWPFRYN